MLPCWCRWSTPCFVQSTQFSCGFILGGMHPRYGRPSHQSQGGRNIYKKSFFALQFLLTVAVNSISFHNLTSSPEFTFRAGVEVPPLSTRWVDYLRELVLDPYPWLCYITKIRLLRKNWMLIWITIIYRVLWTCGQVFCESLKMSYTPSRKLLSSAQLFTSDKRKYTYELIFLRQIWA